MYRVRAYGMMCSLNLTYPARTNGIDGWYSDNYSGLNKGPVVLMIENFRSSFEWELMKRFSHLSTGLKRADFS